MTPLAPLLQAFFSERLVNQRHASPHTIASYRDSFRLLLAFVHQQTGKTPSRRRGSRHSSDTSSTSAATACAPATHA